METSQKAKSVYDLSGEAYVIKLSEELKKINEFEMPKWASYVKTSVSEERPPVNQDWWYIRAASILRKLYILDKPIGTNRLKNLYGGRKNRGHKPERFYTGSGKIIRTILQQLEKAELIKPVTEGIHKGRRIGSMEC